MRTALALALLVLVPACRERSASAGSAQCVNAHIGEVSNLRSVALLAATRPLKPGATYRLSGLPPGIPQG